MLVDTTVSASMIVLILLIIGEPYYKLSATLIGFTKMGISTFVSASIIVLILLIIQEPYSSFVCFMIDIFA